MQRRKLTVMNAVMNDMVGLITLGVEDLERSRDFYSAGLGWSPVLDVENEVVFYQVGHGLLFALFGAKDLATDVGAPIVRGNSFSLAHLVEHPSDVADFLARAEKAGATIVKEAQKAEWGGHHGYFADLDGYLWEIAHNPGIVVAEDGTVTFRDS